MMARMERLTIQTPKGEVSAVWHPAEGPALVVGHGAGAGMDHPFIVGFCEAIADEGIAALRFNFPYMEAGRRTPDQAKNAIGAFRSAFDAAAARSSGRPVLGGGKSYGGRIASMAAAEGMPAAGLVFLGYPLHAPGKTDKPRADHLERIEVPMLFLQGTRDPFANPELLAKVIAKLGNRAVFEPVEGGDHSFRIRGVKADDREIGAALAGAAAPFVRRVAGER
jgi:predicted alpha/beta-hydrolase family hydrolase